MKYLLVVLVLIVVYIVLQLLYSLYYSQKSAQLTKHTFTGKKELGDSTKPVFNLFLAGDSVGAGVGASSFETSLGGRLASYFARDHFVEFENISVSGNRMKNLLTSSLPSEKQDLIVLVVSSNDLFHFTDLKEFRVHTEQVLSRFSTIAKKLIIVEPGDISDPPPIPLVLKPYYKWMGPKYAQIVDEVATKFGNVTHVNPLKPPVSIKDYGDTYAADKFHPNDAGHNYWFDMTKSAF